MKSLLKSPGFAFTAILTLAIGIGANTAIFSVANAVLFRGLPYKDPNRLVVALFGGTNPASPADYFAWRSQSQSFEQVSAAEYWTPNLTGRDRPEQLTGIRVADNLFEMLAVQPALGRTFTSAEEQPDGAPTIVLSNGLWQRRFGGDPNIAGQSITLDGHGYTVLGVMPPDFEFPLFWANHAEFWAPLPLGNRRTSDAQSLRIFARLNPGVTLQQAQNEMDIITRRLAQERPAGQTEAPLRIIPLRDKIIGDVRPLLLLLLGLVGFVLLIACANVANLLLSRGAARQREMAVRTALGATRSRLVQQLLSENALLALFGGGLGLALAFWGLPALRSQLPSDLLPRQEAISIDGAVLAFVLVLSSVATLLFGAVPALQASRSNLNEGLRESSRTTGGQHSHWRRRLLAAAEISMAVVLLVGAGLMIRSFVQLQSLNPGFATKDVLAMTVSVAGTTHSPEASRTAFYRDLVEGVKRLPGVQDASLINHLPLAGDIWNFHFSVENRLAATAEGQPSATYRVTYPGYFGTMQIPLRGRDFTDQDKAGSPEVVIVNQAMATRYFSGQDPIGKRIKLGSPESDSPWLSIVGVIPSVKQKSWTDPVGSEMYLPLMQSRSFLADPASHFSAMTLVVRGVTDASTLANPIRSEVWSLEPNAPISGVASMEEVVADQVSRQRTFMILLTAFAAVGLVLAVIGVYGVMSYSVSLRTREIGLRAALGARPQDVLKLILSEGLSLTAGGLLVGVATSWSLGRLMKGLLFEVSAGDPLTFVSVAAVIALVAFVACYIPARRALRVDPMVSLRND